MEMNIQESGYLEVEHTADWELEVWAPDIERLFEVSARGMYHLAGIILQDKPREIRMFVIDGPDPESMVVNFLSELLFYSEMESLAFDTFDFKKSGNSISAVVEGAGIKSIEKEIKAVTYHNLKIRQGKHGLEARIIFDV
jgi:SHS2 domain-containing protein